MPLRMERRLGQYEPVAPTAEGETAGAATGTVGETVGGTTGTVGETVGDATGTVGESAASVVGGVASFLDGGSLLSANVNVDADANLTAPVAGGLRRTRTSRRRSILRRGEHRLAGRDRAGGGAEPPDRTDPGGRDGQRHGRPGRGRRPVGGAELERMVAA